MDLSSELMAEIAGFCVIDPEDRSPHGRRKHARFPLGTRAAISSLSRGVEGIDTAVVVRDISRAGIGLLSPGKMEVGEEFVIQFSGEHGLPARILCIVQRCQGGGFGGSQFIVGATFELVIFPVQPAPATSNLQTDALTCGNIACLSSPGASEPAVSAPSLLPRIASACVNPLFRAGRWCLQFMQDFSEDVTRTA